jgi:hypothetical protein
MGRRIADRARLGTARQDAPQLQLRDHAQRKNLAHRFYLRKRMSISAFLFALPL